MILWLMEALAGTLVILGLRKVWRAISDTRTMISFLVRDQLQRMEMQKALMQSPQYQRKIFNFDGWHKILSDNLTAESYRIVRTIQNMPNQEREAFGILFRAFEQSVNEAIKKQKL
jgi:hypothetical protein